MDIAAQAWVLLLAAPVLGVALEWAAAAWLAPAPRVRTTITLAAFVAVTIGAYAVGIRFVQVLPNILAGATAYAAYVFLAFSIRRTSWPSMARSAAFVVALVPVAFGYFLGTVGSLGVLFLAGEYGARQETARLGRNIICMKSEAGGPSGGHTLHIHHEWPLLPALHREVKAIAVKSIGEGPSSCAALRSQAISAPL